jgi:predicted cupin superfamily sugar epimerase
MLMREVTVHPRVVELKQRLRLASHPEGGCFSELFRSPGRVQPADGRGERPAVTTIYFLLAAGELGRWHQVLSDEIWHFYEGDALELHTIDPRTWEIESIILGPEAGRARAVHVVRAGCWQAARSTGQYTLVGCTVAPGFDYQDYKIFEPGSAEAEQLHRRFPELVEFL